MQFNVSFNVTQLLSSLIYPELSHWSDLDTVMLEVHVQTLVMSQRALMVNDCTASHTSVLTRDWLVTSTPKQAKDTG